MVTEGQVSELLFQIDRKIYELERDYAEMQNERGKSEADKLIAKRKKETAGRAKQILQKYQSKLNRGVWYSECCDSEIRHFPVDGTQCKECKERNPDTYNVEKSVEDLIEELKQES
ncbi:hypothetical protein OSG_eHP23_00140 [environmental Halophage eHP-23]|nr:hypothetical protein OSG_eHP23_00140 [environmental Halophage eHP-23]